MHAFCLLACDKCRTPAISVETPVERRQSVKAFTWLSSVRVITGEIKGRGRVRGRYTFPPVLGLGHWRYAMSPENFRILSGNGMIRWTLLAVFLVLTVTLQNPLPRSRSWGPWSDNAGCPCAKILDTQVPEAPHDWHKCIIQYAIVAASVR